MVAQHQPAVYRAQGWIAPVVLVDGRAVAVWGYARAGNGLRLNVTPFEPLAPLLIERLHEEAQDLARFLGASTVDLEIDT